MMKNKDYRINKYDERNEKIIDKTNAVMYPTLTIFVGMVVIICIHINNYFPAILLGGVLVLSPLLMYFVKSYYEKIY